MANYPETNTWMNPDFIKYGGLASGIGPIAGGLYGLFGGGGKNPADAAMPYLNQIPGVGHQYYDPWINQGINAMGQTSGVYNQMTMNPGDYYNKIASGYKQSPGYQFKLQQGLGAAGNAAAAGGMAGSPQHQQQATSVAEGIANQDFNDYLNQVLGINRTGLQGQENAQNRGYGASQGLSDLLGSNLAQQANLAFQGQAGENARDKSGWESIFSGIGSALPFLFF
jgi:hypothetical protein